MWLLPLFVQCNILFYFVEFVFYDSWPAFLWQDIWIYPGIALFYPGLARAVLEYRVRTMDGAKYNAKKQGHKVSGGPFNSNSFTILVKI